METSNQENLQPLFDQLTKVHRIREDLIKARLMANNRVKAIARNTKDISDDINPAQYFDTINIAVDQFKNIEKIYEKQMLKIGKQLPLHDWFTTIDGCGSLSFCLLLAETGNLSNYANPAKVWKRMGLAVENGEAHKNRKGNGNGSEGKSTGYSKRRRMIAHRISEAIVKKGTYYQDIYLKRKQYEAERDEEGYNKLFVETKKKSMLIHYKSKLNQERIKNGQAPVFVIDLRAKRYMVKRVIRDFWIEWTNQLGINN